MPTFADALQNLLSAKKWNVTELSRRVPVDRVTISRHVNGRVVPTPSTRTHYAVAFGLTLEQLDALWDAAVTATPLAANPTEDFIAARWALLTGEADARRLYKGAGLSPDTLKVEPGLIKPEQWLALARALRFASRADLESAYRDGDVGRGIVLKISDDDYRVAVEAAAKRGISVEDWVGEAVREKAKGK